MFIGIERMAAKLINLIKVMEIVVIQIVDIHYDSIMMKTKIMHMMILIL